MSGGGRRSVGPPMSKFWSDLQVSGEQISTRDKGLHAPLGLCTPVSIRRYLQFTKRILLSSELLFGLEPNKHSVTESICRRSQTCHERSGYRERPSLRNQVGSELDLTDAGKLNHTATRHHRGSQASGELTVGYRMRQRVAMVCKPRSKLKRVLFSGRSVRRGVQESVPSILTRSAPVTKVQCVRIIPWPGHRSSRLQRRRGSPPGPCSVQLVEQWEGFKFKLHPPLAHPAIRNSSRNYRYRHT